LPSSRLAATASTGEVAVLKEPTRPGPGRPRARRPQRLRPAAALFLLALARAAVESAAAQDANRPRIAVEPIILAQPSARVAFPIRVSRGPRGSFVRVRGLPLRAALSGG
jgi:hypothetical protein